MQIERANEAPTTVHMCSNCGSRFRGEFCAVCGQRKDPADTLGTFVVEVLRSLTDFEGRFLQTLALLATDPGQLTRRYLDGERMRWTSPINVFLASFFALFLTIETLGFDLFEIDDARTVTPALQTAENALAATMQSDSSDLSPVADFWVGFADSLEGRGTVAADGDPPAVRARAAMTELREARRAWDGAASGRSASPAGGGIGADPKTLSAWMQDTLSTFSFLLIPLSLPFVSLLFIGRRDVGAFDHAVFITYSIAFGSLVAAIVITLSAIGVPLDPHLLLAFVAVMTVHHFRHLKGTYRLSAAGALVRTLLLEMAIVVILLTLAVLLALVGIG